MKKICLLNSFLFLTLVGWTQALDGTYIGLELNDLTIDPSGKIYFYGVDTFPKQRHLHEVKVVIKANKITVDKYPVYFDSSGKTYSASDGGFITYGGTLIKSGDIYIAKTKMIAYDYMGFSFFEPPQIVDDTNSNNVKIQPKPSLNKSDQELLGQYDRINERGLFIYFPKGTLLHDYIIRNDKKGIWLNNEFYRRATKKQSP